MQTSTEKQKKQLPGSFWGITAFFNPAGYKNKHENYRIFRENSKRQGLNLLAVELAFNDKPFELNADDADMLVQLRGKNNNILWQQDAMYNIGLKNLPPDCDKIAWLDCDLLFRNDNWVREAADLLREYKALQLFSTIFRLPKKITDSGQLIDPIQGGIEGRYAKSLAYNVSKHGKGIFNPSLELTQIPAGYAWAARREIFDKIGFFDNSSVINGGSDKIMAYAFYGKHWDEILKMTSDDFKEVYDKWFDQAKDLVNGSVYFVEGTVDHLWHGDTKKRRHLNNNLLLKQYNFEPSVDTRKNKDGLLEWASDKKALHKAAKNYFFERLEEWSVRSFFKLSLFMVKNMIFSSIEERIGIIGMNIKKCSPTTYYFLKKFIP